MPSDHGRVHFLKAHYLAELKSHIENTLSPDWVLRIEHAESLDCTYTCWHQWGKALYWISDAGPVIESIRACRVRHPEHCVRLNAEKSSPRTRFIYPVPRP